MPALMHGEHRHRRWGRRVGFGGEVEKERGTRTAHARANSAQGVREDEWRSGVARGRELVLHGRA
jgi:hypothetical protein